MPIMPNYFVSEETAFLILFFALALTIFSFVLINKEKANSLTGFMSSLAKFFDFKTLIIDYILKFIYIFFSIVFILSTFSAIDTYSRYGLSPIEALFGMIVYLVAIRIVFEFIMLIFNLVRNTTEINQHLKNQSGSKTKPAETPVVKNTYSQNNPQPIPQNEAQSNDYNVAPTVFCPNCNTVISDENSVFCTNCGQKVR